MKVIKKKLMVTLVMAMVMEETGKEVMRSMKMNAFII